MDFKELIMQQVHELQAAQEQAFGELFRQYEILRKKNNRVSSEVSAVTAEIFSHVDLGKSLLEKAEKITALEEALKKSETDLKVKSRQIEGQQALLNDLQSQLSSKEKELKDISVKHGYAMKEISSLQTELEKVMKALEEKSAELSKSLGVKKPADIPEVSVNAPTVKETTFFRRSCVPKKSTKTLGLGISGGSPPIRLTGPPSGKLLAIGSKKVQVVDRSTTLTVLDFALANNAVALGLGIAPDGASVIAGTTEGQLLVIGIPDGKIRSEMRGCTGKIRNCSFLSGSHRAYSASADRTVRLWDVGKAVATRSLSVNSQICDAASSADGALIAIGHQNGKISLLSSQANDLRLMDSIDAHAEACCGLCLSGCGNFLVSVGQDDKIVIIDLRTNEVLHRCSHAGFTAFQDASFPSVAPESRIAAACSASDGSVYCYDVNQGHYLGKVSANDAVCLFWGSKTVNGERSFEILTGHKNGSLKWWEATEQNK